VTEDYSRVIGGEQRTTPNPGMEHPRDQLTLNFWLPASQLLKTQSQPSKPLPGTTSVGSQILVAKSLKPIG
jgi:hypothetical protein